MIDSYDENDIVDHLIEWARLHNMTMADSESIRNMMFVYAFNIAVTSPDKCMEYISTLLNITWNRARKYMRPKNGFVADFHIDCECTHKAGLFVVFADTFMAYKLIDRQTKLTVSETDPKSLASLVADLYLIQFQLSIDMVVDCYQYRSKEALLNYTINKFTRKN